MFIFQRSKNFITKYKIINLYSGLISLMAGYLAFKIGIPLPWMLGPLLIVGLLCALKFEIKISKKPLPIFRAFLGCIVGTNFSTEIFLNFREIGISLILLPLFVITMMFCTYIFLKRYMQYDQKQSVMGSMPGGLNEMVLLGNEIGVSGRIITLLHTTRIIIVVVLASVFTFFLKDISNVNSKEILYFSNLIDLPLIFILSFLGYYIGRFLSLPGYSIIGPMIISAVLHSFDLVNLNPNVILIISVQVYLGSNLGLYFKGITFNEFFGPIKAGFLSTFIALIPLTIFVYLLNLLNYDLLSLVLSYSPGGQAEMCILALSVGADMIFVSIHHVFRVFLVIFIASFLKNYLKKTTP